MPIRFMIGLKIIETLVSINKSLRGWRDFLFFSVLVQSHIKSRLKQKETALSKTQFEDYLI